MAVPIWELLRLLQLQWIASKDHGRQVRWNRMELTKIYVSGAMSAILGLKLEKINYYLKFVSLLLRYSNKWSGGGGC